MSRLADVILGLHGFTALAIVFLLPALESSAFVGFVFPGEIAVLLGGVLAFQGRVSLAAAMGAAVAGAVLGDAVGYAIGRRFGRRILHGTIGRFVKEHHVDRAERYLRERGGKAVFLGRFTAALRVMIPGLAGMSGMPYARFALWNVTGGVVWAVGFVLVGYAAGDSWRHVEAVAKRASLVLLLTLVLLGLAVLLARWIGSHQAELNEFRQRMLDRALVARFRRRFDRQLGFVARRLRPEGALGLSLTVSLLALAVVGWAFALIVQDAVAGEASHIDHRVLEFFAGRREPWLTRLVKVNTSLGSANVLIPLVLVVGLLLLRWRRSWQPLLLLSGAYAGAAAVARAVEDITQRPRPPAALAAGHFPGWAFPSGHAAQAAAVWAVLALLVAGLVPSWPRKVAVWAAAMVVIASVGVTRLYLGAHWLSDVVGGWLLGGLWVLALVTAERAVASLRGRGAPVATR